MSPAAALALPVMVLLLAAPTLVSADEARPPAAQSAISVTTPVLDPVRTSLFNTVDLSFDPAEAVYVPFGVTYQHVLNPHVVMDIAMRFQYLAEPAYLLEITYLRNVGNPVGLERDELISLSGTLGFDWHPFDMGLDGLWVGLFPWITFLKERTSFKDGTTSGTLVLRGGLGLSLGFQVALPLNLVLHVSDSAGIGIASDAGLGLFVPGIEIGLGVRF